MGSTSSNDTIALPIIDISPEGNDLAIGKQLIDAAVTYGFLYISTNGTPFTEDNVARQFELSRTFFDSPLGERNSCKIGTDNRGYSGMLNEALDPKNQKRGDLKETMNWGEFRPDGSPDQEVPKCLLAEGIDNGKAIDEVRHYEDLCRTTCKRILDLIGIGLEVEDEANGSGTAFFSRRHGKPSGSTMRWLKYPAVEQDSEYSATEDIRAGAHSDYGSMTLLFQRPSQPGLEVRSPDGNWAPVAVIPEGYHSATFPPILVNIGDLLSYWTNGLLKSTVHRVIFPTDAAKAGQDRYSIVYFCHPENHTELIAVPSKRVKEHILAEDAEIGYGGGAGKEGGKKAMTALEHLKKRLQATYIVRENRS